MSEIASIRKQLGLSQAEFARRLGVTQSTVSRWETGEIPVRERDVLAARQLSSAPRTGDLAPEAAA